MNEPIPASLQRLAIPGRVTFRTGPGGLLRAEATADASRAELFLQGAHLTDWRKPGQPPVLYTSPRSRFEPGQAIRGGVPVIFPWFGPREGGPMHGFARTNPWTLTDATAYPDGRVSLRFHLPLKPDFAEWAALEVQYTVHLGDDLTMELTVTNPAGGSQVTCETCLHTYLAVDDVGRVSLTGLSGAEYLDKTDQFARKMEGADPVRITGETDRIYLNTAAAIELTDPGWGRRIRIEKQGSRSTVLWNPWMAKSQQMTDLGPDAYRHMLCVETGNVADNRLHLSPGQTATLMARVWLP